MKAFGDVSCILGLGGDVWRICEIKESVLCLKRHRKVWQSIYILDTPQEWQFTLSGSADQIQTRQVKVCNYWIIIQSSLFFTGINSQLKSKFMRYSCPSSHSGDMILTVKHNVDTFCLVAINNNLSSQYHCGILHRWLSPCYKALDSTGSKDKDETQMQAKKGTSCKKRMKGAGFNWSSVWPQSSVPLIYCWLTCCADLYLHYLPSFHHKPQIYGFSECQGLKNLVSFFSLSSCPSLSRSLISRGFIHHVIPSSPPPLHFCWLGV